MTLSFSSIEQCERLTARHSGPATAAHREPYVAHGLCQRQQASGCRLSTRWALFLVHCTLFIALACGQAWAQNTTSVPTSMYGVGELAPGEGGRYAGMGNVGIALNRLGFQNTYNPAAITRMDTLCFTFDVGATASFSRYSFLSDQENSLQGNPSKFSLGFRALKRWYMVLGAAPYSSVGYLIYSENEIEGAVGSYVYSTFEGDGGLWKFYMTHAYQLLPNLSLGVNVGMVLGKITQSETQESAVVEYSSKQRAFYIDAGFYYEITDRAKRRWGIGATFSPHMELVRDNDLTYSNSSTSETMEKVFHKSRHYLPMHIGAGLSLTTRRWVATADYNYVDWSKSYTNYTSMTYENQHKINAGFIWVTNPRASRSMEYMAGVGYSNSYISLKSGKMKYIEGSVGVSIPIRYSFVGVGLSWRQQMNSRSGMMQESRISLNVSMTFGERISKSKLR